MKNIINCSFLMLALLFFSCAKDGVNGIDGVTGIQGEQGIDGEDGNANVISVLFEDQTITTGTNVFDVPQVTQTILDTGLVYGFVTVAGNDYWEVLPISQAQLIILEIDAISLGELTLRSTFEQANLRLRFVLVEGVDASSTNFNTYEELASYYKLD